jgi:hypothetical protein
MQPGRYHLSRDTLSHSDDFEHAIGLLDAADAAFVMSTVMAVCRLNPPPRVGYEST